MITGSGLIANALRDTFENDESVFVFARGVSNSGCVDVSAYQRELDMIQSFSQTYSDKIFVYFSTTSVFDPEKMDSPYVKSKSNFENIIASLFSKSIIVRLPIIVGRNNNENQLFGYLLKAIKQGQTIQVHNHAGRYLIDIADLSTIVNKVVEYYKQQVKSGNLTINICGDQPIRIDTIISMLSNAIGIQPNLSVVESGSTYFVNNTLVKSIVSNQMLNKDYQEVFNSYYR